ncbi:MAG: PD-(D/E)XK nuclease family protein, partial [Thermoplasmata archaeon]
LYPRVIDTEHKLQVSLEDFVLHGVVDVLAQTAGEAKNGREIWDYKGSQRVASDSAEMENYEFQMQVYAELYRQKNGQFPQRAVLCFLGEKELEDMLVEVPFGKRSISRAMNVFQGTVAEIERRRTLDDWSPPSQIPSRETCGACDIRWDCPTAGHMFPMRHP